MYVFRENLELMREMNERAAQGRACGNLGNTYYLLGNFQQAIHYHEEVSCVDWGNVLMENRIIIMHTMTDVTETENSP
jgi:hypothetical protein